MSDLAERLREYRKNHTECEHTFNIFDDAAKHIAKLEAELDRITTIAHEGGLEGMSQFDALTAVRRLTAYIYHKRQQPVEMSDDIR